MVEWRVVVFQQSIYYTDTLMEYDSNDMFVMVFLDKRNTNYNSPDMESDGFEKALNDFLIGEGLNIAKVVTDAHSVIARIMSRFKKYFVA